MSLQSLFVPLSATTRVQYVRRKARFIHEKLQGKTRNILRGGGGGRKTQWGPLEPTGAQGRPILGLKSLKLETNNANLTSAKKIKM